MITWETAVTLRVGAGEALTAFNNKNNSTKKTTKKKRSRVS